MKDTSLAVKTAGFFAEKSGAAQRPGRSYVRDPFGHLVDILSHG
jgi:hypothetical protein